MVAGAILFSGSSASKALNMFTFSNIKMIGQRTYSRIQRSFLLKAKGNVWDSHQRDILSDCEDGVKLGGDDRCCYPGHTAKYGSYTLMDMTTGYVLDIQLVQVRIDHLPQFGIIIIDHNGCMRQWPLFYLQVLFLPTSLNVN